MKKAVDVCLSTKQTSKSTAAKSLKVKKPLEIMAFFNFDRRKDEGFYWSSPLQIYLELASEGKSERETADVMVEGLLDSNSKNSV